MADLDYITLRRSYKHQSLGCSDLAPCNISQVFSRREFFSPDFINNWTFRLRCATKSSTEDESIQRQLVNLVDQADRAFGTVREQLDLLQRNFLQRMTTLFTGRDQMEYTRVIEQELKRCHQQILRHRDSDRLVEDLSQLMDKFKAEIKSRCLLTIEERVLRITQELEKTVEQLHTAIKTVPLEEGLDLPSRRYRRYETDEAGEIRRKDREINFPEIRLGASQGLHINWNGPDYFMFNIKAGQGDQMLEKHGLLSFYNSKIFQTVSSSEQLGGRYDYGENMYFYKPYNYSESLNCVLIKESMRADLKIYKVTSRGLLKVATIPMKGMILIIEPQRMVAVYLEERLWLFNILTRERTTWSRRFKRPVNSMDFIRQSNLLVVTTSHMLFVFSVLRRGALLHLRYQYNIYNMMHEYSTSAIASKNYVILYKIENDEKYLDTCYQIVFYIMKMTRQGIFLVGTTSPDLKHKKSRPICILSMSLLPDFKGIRVCHQSGRETNRPVEIKDFYTSLYNMNGREIKHEDPHLTMWSDGDTEIFLEENKLYLSFGGSYNHNKSSTMSEDESNEEDEGEDEDENEEGEEYIITN